MPEDLKVDCFKCADLEFARNLAAQMREGYGRWNSNRTFRNYRLAGLDAAYGDSQQSQVWPYAPGEYLRENQQARVIGRTGDHAVRERWQDCEIGDAVPESKMDHGYALATLAGTKIIDKCLVVDRPMPRAMWEREGEVPHLATTVPYEKRTFERVCIRMLSNYGVSTDEYFWKRIS